MLELKGKPKSELIVKIGQGHVVVCYDRQGRLRLMREAKDGKIPRRKPTADETVFRVQDFEAGESTFKSGASACGYFSANGQIYWNTIWDAAASAVKRCGFQEWVMECAEVLAGEKAQIAPI